MKESIVSLLDENGRPAEFEHLLTFAHNGRYYIVFIPVEPVENAGEGEVMIMRILEDESGEDAYLPLDNEIELQEVWQVFKNIYYNSEEPGG